MQDQNVTELLDTFQTAISEGNYEDAATAATRLAATYEEKQPVEEAAVQRSTAARSQSGLSDDEQSALHGHVQQATATRLTRGAFLTETAAFLVAPDRGDPGAVVETARTLQQRERTLRDATDRATDATDGVSLPPTLSVVVQPASDEFARDESVEFTVAVGNVGDATANGVEVEFSGGGVSFDSPTASVGTVEPDAVRDLTVVITGDSPGQQTVTTSVTSDDAGSERVRTSVTVRGSERERVLRVTKGDRKSERAGFVLSVDGELEPGDDAESVVKGASAVDWVGPERGTDSFRYSGEIRTFVLKGAAEVYVNDERVDPASLGSSSDAAVESYPNRLTVTKENASDGFAVFAVEVSGAVARGRDSEAVIQGRTALDTVGPATGTDRLQYAGRIERFLLKGSATVRVNGRRANPDEL